MFFHLFALAPLASAGVIQQRQSYFGFGNAFSTGPVAEGSWIAHATTTLVLPELNSPHVGNMALWPGVGTDGDDLVQGLAISTVGGGSPCNLGEEDLVWCVLTSTLEDYQNHGPHVTANPGDEATYDYLYNDADATYEQTVTLNGVVVSQLTTETAHGTGWGTAIECQQVACGTVPQHQYLNTTIVLGTADPNYSQTLGLTGATGDLVTSDGGKTWKVDTITIEEFTFE